MCNYMYVLKLNTLSLNLTWWIRTSSFVAVISAVVKVIANLCLDDAVTISTSRFIILTHYN